MADFEQAVKLTLVNEGGFVNNPADPGGATKYGVTQKDMPDVNIADITPEQATEYYREHYWKPLYSEIQSQEIANKLFDMGVLFGIGEAVKLLQIVLQTAYPMLVVDEEFGPTTLGYVNDSDPGTLLAAYKTALVTYTLRIVTNRPNLRVFAAGWGRRINS
jgi:lysozyme family protein